MTIPAVDPWAALRRTTAARIGLGRAGDAVPTRVLLDLRAAAALARDAVHDALDPDALRGQLQGLPTVEVTSRSADRATFLQRPDLGRLLDPESAARLQAGPHDVAFVLADGLSARATQAHAAEVVTRTLALLPGWSVAPVVLATQARVALGDEVGERLGAALVVVLLGERPGLSSPDSLGAYLTWDPRSGRMDSERNCLSNIRPAGLAPALAAARLAGLLTEARRRQLSGVRLKDDSALPGTP